MRPPTWLAFTLLSTFVKAKPIAPSQTITYPWRLYNGQSVPEDISQKGRLDTPKMKPGVNATSVDWWYFDAVSTSSQNESITVIFYSHGPDSFDIPYDGGPLTLQIVGTFDNGTQFGFTDSAPNGAVFKVSPEGLKGEWKGAGGSFEGSNLDQADPEYVVVLNNTKYEVFGTLKLKPISPSHYPCDINKPNVSQQIFPRYYWSNAVPDSSATVDVTIQGRPLKFTGNGYHDKNWATTHIKNEVRSWYWGHGRAGPYSLVWFDTITLDGKEHFSSWITKDGMVVAQSCDPEAIVVRPWGENDQFPPPPSLAAPSGYRLKYNIGDQVFQANFTRELVTLSTDTYKRMIGSFTGGFLDGNQYIGRSLCEQFQF